MQSKVKEAMFQSRQMGKRENKVINIEGRVQFDLLQVSTATFIVTCFADTVNLGF
jgi:hypothetical protein